MQSSIRKLLLVLSTTVLATLPATAPRADDTEVYVGGAAGSSGVRPNVLFIIDTSGSMNTSVTLTNGTYDPATTYTGSCDSNRIYFTTNGSPPDCGTSNYFNSSANYCNDSALALSATGSGYYLGRFARYRNARNDYWTNLSNSSHADPVECQADYNKHGNGVDTTKLYPADQNKGGPWTATETDAIGWSGTGRNYTIYSANYLNWYWSPGTTTTSTRLGVVKDAFANLLNSISGINAGLMRFSSGGDGGYFLQPMLELNTTNRTTLIDSANSLSANGLTPLAETLYEASLYWRGQPVDFGDSSTPAHNINSVLDPVDTTRYKTPMQYQCQKNFVVLLTDGEPTDDTAADAKIRGLTNFSSLTGSSTCTGDCLDELAQWMYKSDLNDMNDKQNVITYTIGLQTDQVLLSDTARKGGGTYHTVENATDLSTAFTNILTDILSVNDTFIAPAVTVNAFNRLTHRDELYFAVFRPAGSPNWPGNVKRYKLTTSPSMIVDANNANAVDVNTGFFSGSSRSFWTLDADAPDGDDVEKGGAAGLLSTSRSVYTYTGATAPINANLRGTVDYHFDESNTTLTKDLLGISAQTDAYRTSLIQWARGVDVLDNDEDGDTTDARRAMGDILHNKPVLVTYGGTDASPDITLFVGTNEGFLHAINATTGQEQFSFIPKELLPILKSRYENSDTAPHPYGLDGSLSVWHKDVNGDRLVLNSDSTPQTGESVYLYTGMRRGGNSYYALDVTDRNTPILKWQITGGAGDFTELGQTWSRPTVAKIKLHNGTELVDRTVLIFGGGYDTDQDSAALPVDDTIGRAIYIIDADTGQRLWWASSAVTANLVLPEMTNSIPSDVTVIDVNADGYADRIYVGDMGGRVWRIDLDNTTNTGAATLATGGVLADLGGTGAANNRRFYYAPDVALMRSSGGFVLTVSLGSGYRAHPLNQVIQDRFYVIRDANVYGPPADADIDGTPDYPGYLESDLYDATTNDLGQLTGVALDAARSSFNSLHGWYIRLARPDGSYDGEKVLSSSLTLDHKVYFTTFTPVASAHSSSCAPSQGTARVYVVSLADATPVKDLLPDGTLTRNDRSIGLARGGIPPTPTLIFPSDGSAPVITVGPEIPQGIQDNTQKVNKLYWRQEE